MDKIIQYPSSDPAVRMAGVLDRDMKRKAVYDRVLRLIDEYRLTYNCEPSWVRISYDVAQPLGDELLFSDDRPVCGLKFVIDQQHAGRVEVGSSVMEDRI